MDGLIFWLSMIVIGSLVGLVVFGLCLTAMDIPDPVGNKKDEEK